MNSLSMILRCGSEGKVRSIVSFKNIIRWFSKETNAKESEVIVRVKNPHEDVPFDPYHEGKVTMLHSGKWVGVGHITDDKDKIELIYRTTRGKFFAGVNVFPIQGSDSEDLTPKVHLIENFRIPVWKRVLEVPAGLAEVGTTIEENAIREVREEIGVDLWLCIV